MRIVGIAGGIASGKSKVAELLAKRGAIVINADRIGHALLDEEAIRERIQTSFGNQIIDARGKIDRETLGKLVFGNDANAAEHLKALEAILHPAIRQEAKRRIEVARKAGAEMVVLDAPLLFEAGWDVECDDVVFVDTPDDIRLERATHRGWTRDELRRREDAQMPISEKRARSTIVVSNGGSLEELERHVDQIWSKALHRPLGH